MHMNVTSAAQHENVLMVSDFEAETFQLRLPSV